MLKLVTPLVFLITLTHANTAFALTKVTASIDVNPVMSNESIVLTVVANDNVERSALDTSPLNANFMVVRSEVSSQTSMVNFKTTRTTRWQIVLMPRKTGKLLIPSLVIDNVSSKPIEVNVVEQGSSASTKQQDIFIASQLSSNDIYVQQLVTLTVKLHIGVQIQRGSLTEPDLPEATIVQVGKDQESDGIVNGKRYRIIERTYAITPEKSGEFTLNSPMFAGEIMVQSSRRSGFLSFGETKPVNILGEKLTLKVRPIPDNYPSYATWLPSEFLSLHQEWQPNTNEFTVGEPITRTITLTAAGLAKSQLPIIEMTAPDGLKIYPDQAELNANLTKERLVSQKKQNFALVASKAGQYVLPKITIAWWNTITNKYQQAVLPEQTITVIANPDSKTQQLPPNPIKTPKINSPSSIVDNNVNVSAPIFVAEQSSKLQWLFLTLWILTLLFWLTHIIYLQRNQDKAENTKHTSINNHYLALLAACKQNNAEQALNLLIPWINSISDQPKVSTLAKAIELMNSSALIQAINDVQQSLYGQSSIASPWQGKSLLSAVQAVNANKHKKTVASDIKLNP
ncbi:MAG: BatD family protein [Litorilituus sp.]|nr:BatD family protein [Litorilituus sp.]